MSQARYDEVADWYDAEFATSELGASARAIASTKSSATCTSDRVAVAIATTVAWPLRGALTG